MTTTTIKFNPEVKEFRGTTLGLKTRTLSLKDSRSTPVIKKGSKWREVAKRCSRRRNGTKRLRKQPNRYLKPFTGKLLDQICQEYDLDEPEVTKVTKAKSRTSQGVVVCDSLDSAIDPCRDWSGFHTTPVRVCVRDALDSTIDPCRDWSGFGTSRL